MFGQSTPPPDVLTWLADNIGTFVLLIVIVWGAMKEWWVPGTTHRRMVRERDELLKLALRSQTVTERTVRAAETFVEGAGDEAAT